MAEIVTYEVEGRDANGDLWIVASKKRESAEAVAERFRNEGYGEVKVTALTKS